MWVVVYTKVVEDKTNGITVSGAQFGGASEDKTSAESIARECVNTIRGGTIIPKIYRMDNQQSLPKIMEDAEKFFSKKRTQMMDAASIMTRNKKR